MFFSKYSCISAWFLLPKPANPIAGYSILPFPFTASSLRPIHLLKTHQLSGKVVRRLILSLLTVLLKPFWSPFAPEWNKTIGCIPGPFQDNPCVSGSTGVLLADLWQSDFILPWEQPVIFPHLSFNCQGLSWCQPLCKAMPWTPAANRDRKHLYRCLKGYPR